LTQVCTVCGKPSLPGLTAGNGKCQFHWDAGVWGEAWAERAEAERAQASRPKAIKPQSLTQERYVAAWHVKRSLRWAVLACVVLAPAAHATTWYYADDPLRMCTTPKFGPPEIVELYAGIDGGVTVDDNGVRVILHVPKSIPGLFRAPGRDTRRFFRSLFACQADMAARLNYRSAMAD
jgi:hypothetical protein